MLDDNTALSHPHQSRFRYIPRCNGKRTGHPPDGISRLASRGPFWFALYGRDDDSKRRYNILTNALVGMFNGMGLAFMQREFEFRNPPDTRYSMASFLPRFDAIFSLNQGTLLEEKYIRGQSDSFNQRLASSEIRRCLVALCDRRIS
jgi:hypothetical protein